MTKKDVTIYYGLTMAVYSIGFVTMSAFSSVFLLDIGLSNGSVGILLAISSLLSVLFQPIVGSMIDRSSLLTTKGAVLGMSILVVVLGLFITLFPGMPLTINTLLYGGAVMLLMLAQPFMNALGTDAINYGYPINLGMGRSLGSLGYAIGSYAFGVISVAVGPRCIPVAFSIAFCILCLMLYFYPVKVTKQASLQDAGTQLQREKSEAKRENPFLFLLKYKRFGIMFIGLIFIYFSHSLINTFALQVVVPKGGDSGTMGTASAIAAGCELVTAVLFTWYMKRIKLHHILRISGIFFTLKTLFSMLVTSVLGFYCIQAFQMFGWGFMSVGIVYYVNYLVGESDKAQGQAYAGMSFTIASVLATFLGGNMIDLFGVNRMLLAGTIAAGIGTIIIWFAAGEVKQSNKNQTKIKQNKKTYFIHAKTML